MEKNTIPAQQNAPEAGLEEEKNPAAPEPQSVAPNSKDVEDALVLVEDYRKELESAQKKIVHLEKRGQSGQGGEVSVELQDEIASLREEIVALRESQVNQVKEDRDNLSKLRTREAELRAALLAKNTATNTSMGANQDKTTPETPLPTLNRQQEVLYARIAQRKGITLDEWRKQNKK